MSALVVQWFILGGQGGVPPQKGGKERKNQKGESKFAMKFKWIMIMI